MQEKVNEIVEYALHSELVKAKSIDKIKPCLCKKIKTGVFDEAKAIKAFRHTANMAAKCLTKSETGMFQYGDYLPEERKQAAEEIMKSVMHDTPMR